MKIIRHFYVTVVSVLLVAQAASAQNFNPPPGVYQQNLERNLKRYGQVERIYPIDYKTKTFQAEPGGLYVVAAVYDVNDKSKRRNMVYRLGPKGERLEPHYSDDLVGFRGTPGMQMFPVRLKVPADEPGPVTYRIDCALSATVYVYKIVRGLK